MSTRASQLRYFCVEQQDAVGVGALGQDSEFGRVGWGVWGVLGEDFVQGEGLVGKGRGGALRLGVGLFESAEGERDEIWRVRYALIVALFSR